MHPATDPDDAAQEPSPIQFGDLRQPLGCEYIAQVCVGSQGAYVAGGNKEYVYPFPHLFSFDLVVDDDDDDVNEYCNLV